MPKNYKDKVFHVISNTHWDREWRFPFQKNRQHLVDMMDSVLEILENDPDYRAFHLDSQSIVLHDYLDIRPEKKDQITKFVKNDRLFIGPWYILPDEFMISGENLIRNLLLGHETCQEFGKVSKIGYSPFSWGQISQLPQLYNGFDIDLIMFYRGMNSLDSKKAEFLWTGADGTEALASRFSTMPRYNFYFFLYRPVIFNETPQDIEYDWKRGGLPSHFADKEQYKDDYLLLKPNDTYYEKNITTWIKKLIDEQVNDFTSPHVIWMEGHDSSGPNPKTTQIIKDIKRLMPDIDVRHSSLEDYAKFLAQDIDRSTLKKVTGERRSAQYDHRSGNLYGYITSARMYLKQMNADAERWLERYAEPMYTIAGMQGLNISDQSLKIAWRLLIENSAHDSIGGCSLDAIHDDMVNRYKQIKEICESIFSKAVKHLIKNLNCPGKKDSDIHLSVINTTQFKRSEIIEAYVDVPFSMDKGSFEIRNSENSLIPIEILSVSDNEPVLEQLINRPMHFTMKRYHILLSVKGLPGLSMNTYHVKPLEGKVNTLQKAIVQKAKLDNSYLSVNVNFDGTLTIYDKVSARKIENTAYYEDEGEAGHAWTHERVEPVLTTKGVPGIIHFMRDNSLMQQVKIIHHLPISKDLKERKLGLASFNMKIETLITLKYDSKIIEFETYIDNPSVDHRLRMIFNTDVFANNSRAQGQFDVVKRSTERPDTKDWVEQPQYDHPVYHFMNIRDDEKGYALFLDGLKEYEVLADKSTLAITLFRAFRYIIQPSSKQDYSEQKGSQCLGRQKARFAFYPFDITEVNSLYEKALTYNTSLRIVEHGNTMGDIKSGKSFFELTNNAIVISCIKQAQNRDPNTYILRLYNPTTEIQVTALSSKFKLKKAIESSLEEIDLKEINLDKIELKAKKIITIKLYI
ncbi:MAG: glycoside hydrolase family 38 C-terminal domain-containing protein [Candidatus Neomarinimicrobiota bacterium]